jgi:hypothetical protein
MHLSIGGADAAQAIESIACYTLWIGIGQVVRADLTVAAELLGDGMEGLGPSLVAHSERILGSSNTSITPAFRTSLRDPWITEVIAHMLLKLSQNQPRLFPVGRLHCLTLVHPDPSDHGLDLMGLYEDQTADLGLTVSEVKASELHISDHVTACADLFEQIDIGRRDVEIRAKIQLLRDSLPANLRSRLTASFWADRRSYMPTAAHASTAIFNPGAPRQRFRDLLVPADRIHLVGLSLGSYGAYFDAIADRVRTLAAGVV